MSCDTGIQFCLDDTDIQILTEKLMLHKEVKEQKGEISKLKEDKAKLKRRIFGLSQVNKSDDKVKLSLAFPHWLYFCGLQIF